MAVPLPALFAAFTVIVAGAWLARQATRAMRLPGVVGELAFGILLGPSLFGWLAPDLHGRLFPDELEPVLSACSWIGLVLFVLMAGLEMEWSRGHLRPLASVSLGGLVVPLAAGILLAFAWPALFFDGAASWRTAAAVGVVLTVTALPVLARILEETVARGDVLWPLAMGSATIADVVGWLALPVVLGVGESHLTGSLPLDLAVLAVGTVILFAAAGRLRRHWNGPGVLASKPASVFPGLVALAFGAAWLTESAGLNGVLGPFAVGGAASRVPALRSNVQAELGGLTRTVFLPVFFVVSGAAVDAHALDGGQWLGLLVLCVVATGAKFVGASLGGRMAGVDGPRSNALGVLLNARGAVGLVAAAVAYGAGLVSVLGYTLLVLMVTITTLAAAVLARVVAGGQPQS